LPLFTGRAGFGGIAFLLTAGAAWGQGGGPTCAQLLQAQDAKAVAVCKAELDAAENAPASERLARIVGNDEYGVALLAVAHKPKQSLEAFDRAVALLPASTVKPVSLQWAVIFWHRATAYQQLQDWERAGADLKTAENTFTAAITAAEGDVALAENFRQLRQRVRKQYADVLEHQGKHKEAQRLLATQ
jgi:tetratricopeptide (TPR) repeat protein